MMDATIAEMQAWLDRAKIRDCVARLARGEDRRSAAVITACYWSDARVDLGVFEGSFADYLAWVVPGAEVIEDTQHFLGQTVIDLDGETARAETHVMSYHRVDMGAGYRDATMGGRYLDRMEKRDGEWRIAHRTMLYDWSQDWGASIDWAQGVMGMPFSADHFSGRAHGDFSEIFFGERKA